MKNCHCNVFLTCHHDTGCTFARILQEAFLNRGLTVCCELDIVKDTSFYAAVEACDVFVAALSDGFFQFDIEDNRPLMELKYALACGKKVVPVIRMDTDVKMPIREDHYLLMDCDLLSGIPVTDISLGANFDESIDKCVEERFPNELKPRSRAGGTLQPAAVSPLPTPDGTDDAFGMLEEMSRHPMGTALTKLALIASFFTSEGFRKHVLRRLWDVLVVLDKGSEVTFEAAFDYLVANGWLFGSSKEYNMPRRMSILLRRVPHNAYSEIEESIGRALRNYLGMFPQDWLPLADSTSILSSIPEFVLLWRQNDERLFSSSRSLQTRLLIRNPGFLPFCRLDLLNGWDWAGLLGFHPQLADHCPWEKLEADDWKWLLKLQPQFGNHCPWEEMDEWDWSALLASQPQLSSCYPWEIHNGTAWTLLLEDQPQFADRCPWKQLKGQDWSRLLRHQPQLADYCCWEKLDGGDWENLLIEQPKFVEHCELSTLHALHWRRLLIFQPQFADRCPWEQLSGYDWQSLLEHQPQFADRCAWEKLEGMDWARLLRVRPQFSSYCRWETLDGKAWAFLLADQPQFAEHCPWTQLNGRDWGYLLGGQPQFEDHCDWSQLSAENWRNLLECQPQFINRGSKKVLDCMNWAKLLRHQPSLAEHCPWDKLDGRDWVFLLEGQPQFADRCPLEVFQDWDRRELLQKLPQSGGLIL